METITITINEFKNLLDVNSSERVEKKMLYGKFALTKKAHDIQCSDLKIGDKVFYMNVQPRVPQTDPPEVNCMLTEAEVIEGT